MNPGPAADAEDTPEPRLRQRLGELANSPALDGATRALLAEAAAAWERSEAAHVAAENRYRTLFDAVPDPVSIIDRDGTMLDVNAAGMRLFGRSRESVVGQPVHVINPDLSSDHMHPVHAALDRGERHMAAATNVRADGSRFPVEVHSVAIEYQGVPRIVAVARDLSGRADIERRYIDLMESVDKGIVVQDAEGRVLHVNGPAMRILGLEAGHSADAAFHTGHWLVVDENGVPMSRSDVPAMVALRTAKAVESRVIGLFRFDSDEFRWLSVTVIPRFNPQSARTEETLSLFSDITELKRDSAMFERVQALATIGAWELNRADASVFLTRGARRILDRDAPPASLDAFRACFVPGDSARLAEAIENAFDTERPFSLELRAVRGDGSECWVQLQGEVDAKDPSINRMTGTLSDISQHKSIEDGLRRQARTDPLTGLLNRDAALDELDAHLSGVDAHLAVLYIDLDRFKIINDVLGHNVGDRLLCAVAERLRGAAGADALCARLGGDEFLVMCRLAGDGDEHHIHVAESILAAAAQPFRIDQEEFSISASIGIAESPRDGTRSGELIQNADAAMYDSKRRACNGWQSYSEDLARRQRDRLQVDFHMRSALDNNEIALLYQPQVDLVSGRVTGAEALMRWHNPQLGPMKPDVFISHAENSGEIIRLGAWALHEACMQVRRWRDQGHRTVRMAVNVSYRQFLADDLAGTVEAALQAAGIPGSALELEFTERVLIEDEPETLRTFAQLRDLGVMLSIDDFGEGYSALNYLRRLPIHGLKLSQLFLQGVPGNSSDVAVCQAVVGIARSLRLGLVAEGVETEAQRRFLTGLGVPVGQGFLFSQPLLPEDFARLLAAQPAVALHA